MNFSFYILGTPEGRYSQYPDDYTASTLAELQDGMVGARLAIYREMDLVHYAYSERFGNNRIIGFCLIFNKARIQKPSQLIRLFRFIIEKRLVESGEIIKYTDDGELKFKVRSMSECIKEYDRLKGFINSVFENYASKYYIEPLTTIYNGIRSTGELDRNASDDRIVALTNQHNKVIVNDDNGIEHGYIPQVIASLRDQNQNDIFSACIAKAMAPTKKDRFRSVKDFLNTINSGGESTVIDVDITKGSDNIPVGDNGQVVDSSNTISQFLKYRYYGGIVLNSLVAIYMLKAIISGGMYDYEWDYNYNITEQWIVCATCFASALLEYFYIRGLRFTFYLFLMSNAIFWFFAISLFSVDSKTGVSYFNIGIYFFIIITSITSLANYFTDKKKRVKTKQYTYNKQH